MLLVNPNYEHITDNEKERKVKIGTLKPLVQHYINTLPNDIEHVDAQIIKVKLSELIEAGKMPILTIEDLTDDFLIALADDNGLTYQL